MEVFIKDMERDELRGGYLVTAHKKKLWNVELGLLKEFTRICDRHNLWLIDERLTFHSFAASDRPLNKIGDSKSEDRPDIVVVSEVDKVSRVARSVAIIELKRPERSEYQEPITEQVYRMHDEIKNGRTINPKTGHKISVDEATRYYCYALCDFNDKVEKAVKYGGYQELPGKYGYFKYNSELKLACYVIRYDRIVADARQRNFAFFEKLKIND